MKRLLVLLLLLGGCTKKKKPAPPPEDKPVQTEEKKFKRGEGEPDRLEISIVLIAFKGSVPGSKATRSRDEAKQLAEELFEAAKKPGCDFQGLVDQYAEPAHHNPGGLGLCNYDVPAQGNERQRQQMLRSWGPTVLDSVFRLKEGEVTLIAYDGSAVKGGWWLIKRTK